MSRKPFIMAAILALLPYAANATVIADDIQCSPTGCVGTTDLGSNAVTSPKIKDGTITNADISNTAAIDPSKIAGVSWTKYGYLGIDGTPIKPLTVYAGDNDALALLSNSSDNWYVGPNVVAAGFGIYDATQGASRLQITTAGDIGIGTASPLAKLHVLTDNTGLVIDNPPGGGSDISSLRFDYNGLLRWQIDSRNGNEDQGDDFWISTGGDPQLMIDQGSNFVGIGTTSPIGQLDVRSEATALVLDNPAGGAGDVTQMIFAKNGTPTWIIASRNGNEGQGDDLWLMNRAYTPVMSVDQETGYIGIGTTTPPRPLTVAAGDTDALLLQSNSNHNWYVGPNVAGQRFGIYDATDGATKFKIQSNGDICLGSCN